MKIGSIKDMSMVDGPGQRLTIFFTGCVHACPGCIVENSNSVIKGINKDINLEDIKIGDIIWSPYGETEVKSLIYEEQESYNIELENGTILQVGENHPFIINNKQVLAKDLKKGDYLLQ